MRGVFTCGVLDYMMDAGVRFPYGVGVSAGACHGVSFVSGQRGRARFTAIDAMHHHHYIGLQYLWRQHSIMDMDLLYDELPMRIYPFDFQAYQANPMRFEIVTTDCQTGAPCYMEERADEPRLVQLCRASSSLPYVCPICPIDGRPMLDGGIVDSIPLQRALSQGYPQAVVVLTRNLGYRKGDRDIKIPPFLYHRYPRLRVALSQRGSTYNRQLALVEQLEAEGRILVIRPQQPIRVSRMERNVARLEALYQEGYDVAREMLQGRFEAHKPSL